jgi:DNA-binding GntR family transcriptional regulator
MGRTARIVAADHGPAPDIQQRLRNDIVAGELPFGSRLIIEELALRYGVSHMPIREALRVLHGEGLVVIEPNRGARVRPLYRGFIEDLFDVRCAIETLLARRAAERRTPAHLSRLRAAAGQLEALVENGRVAEVTHANRAFHAAINDAAGNPGALPIVDSHWLLLAALLKRYGYGDERFPRVIEEHQHLIYAIERQDGNAAALLMGAHIEKAKNNLLRRAAALTPADAGARDAPSRRDGARTEAEHAR